MLAVLRLPLHDKQRAETALAAVALPQAGHQLQVARLFGADTPVSNLRACPRPVQSLVTGGKSWHRPHNLTERIRWKHERTASLSNCIPIVGATVDSVLIKCLLFEDPCSYEDCHALT